MEYKVSGAAPTYKVSFSNLTLQNPRTGVYYAAKDTESILVTRHVKPTRFDIADELYKRLGSYLQIGDFTYRIKKA